jgi:hypothetical protein
MKTAELKSKIITQLRFHRVSGKHEDLTADHIIEIMQSNLWTSPCICPNDEKTGEMLCCNLCGQPSARTESRELPGDVKFEELLHAQLDELPYTKHVDDGQYNDGVLVGWELGSRWFYSLVLPLLASKDARIRELEEELERLVSIIENGIDAEEDKFLGDCGS